LLALETRAAIRRTKEQQFEILIADLSSFELLLEYRQDSTATVKRLKWAEEGNWPSWRVAIGIAKAHGRGNLWGVPTAWEKVASINPSITQMSPAEAVTSYSQTVEERTLVSYWISAGFLVRD
jgi:hypothetical protein